MDQQRNEWNDIYRKTGSGKPVCDDWLDQFESVLALSKDMAIIDLGCGFGNDTLYLTEKQYRVISCDYSEEALNRLKHFIKEPDTRLFDMLGGLPFEDESVRVVIADLSLHYFSWEDTMKIIRDISRVLVNGGYLLCRVNSTKDHHYGAGQGTQVEPNYYHVNGKYKRFFDQPAIERLFEDGWVVKHLAECEMNRYQETKIVWEVLIQNDKDQVHEG